jgi:hypothetical protein
MHGLLDHQMASAQNATERRKRIHAETCFEAAFEAANNTAVADLRIYTHDVMMPSVRAASSQNYVGFC